MFLQHSFPHHLLASDSRCRTNLFYKAAGRRFMFLELQSLTCRPSFKSNKRNSMFLQNLLPRFHSCMSVKQLFKRSAIWTADSFKGLERHMTPSACLCPGNERLICDCPSKQHIPDFRFCI